jgi:ubiquinol-cytochrome c reductase cytochrome c subunit
MILHSCKSAAAPCILTAAFLFLLATPGVTQGQGASSGQAAAPAGNAGKGRQLFDSYGCWACHGKEGQGGVAGPRIGPNPPGFAGFVAYVRKPANQMPPFTDKVVSDADLADIYAFLQSRPQPKPVREIPLLND